MCMVYGAAGVDGCAVALAGGFSHVLLGQQHSTAATCTRWQHISHQQQSRESSVVYVDDSLAGSRVQPAGVLYCVPSLVCNRPL